MKEEEELRRNPTREFKLQCCRQLATGRKRPAQICRKRNLAESVLLRRRRPYEARGEAAFAEEESSSPRSRGLGREGTARSKAGGSSAQEGGVVSAGLQRFDGELGRLCLLR